MFWSLVTRLSVPSSHICGSVADSDATSMRARCLIASSVMLITARVMRDVPKGRSKVAPWAMGSMRARPMEC